MEELIYTVGIPNADRDYAYLVTIENNVLEHYRYAEIERLVTGTNHVTVCTPDHYDGSIDEEVCVALDTNSNLIIATNN